MYPEPAHTHPPFFPSPNLSPAPQIRPPNLQLLPFDGQEPLDWLFQAEKFFLFYQVPIEQRLPMAAFYMKGEALSWYKWMYQNHQLFDWKSFSWALELRFGPSSYENHQAELFKLRQSGSVSEYQTQFEKLCNRVYGLSPDALLNCFISGLYPEIRKEIAILKPPSITQAIGLAKLIEAKLKDSRTKQFRTSFHQTPSSSNNLSPSLIPSSTTTNPSPTLPIKRLTSAQMQECRAQGLCYNCDAKFILGHRCNTLQFLLLLAEDEEENPANPLLIEEVPEGESDAIYRLLSPEAISGYTSPKALKFSGLIKGLPVTILVDTGSTHNIIQPRIAHHLHLFHNSIKPFTMMVGNGANLTCTDSCPNVPLWIQNHYFEVPCYLLPVEGADIILGLAWLTTLG